MLQIIKNPHSVLAALHARPKAVKKIYCSTDKPSAGWDQVITLAKKCCVPIGLPPKPSIIIKKFSSKPELPGPGRGTNCYAEIEEKSPSQMSYFFQAEQGFWLALDQLQDPQNVGSIFRTASFFGAKGILLTEHHSTAITASVCDTASGGMETVPFIRVTNLTQAIEKAKEQDIWTLGTSEHAKKDLTTIPIDRKWLIILGGEEKGLRSKTEKHCDMITRIPSFGEETAVHSLNVAIASGILCHYFATGYKASS